MLFTIPADGVYQIRVFTDEPLYMTLTSDASQVLLQPLDARNDKQKWNFRRVTDRHNIFKITSLDDQYILTFPSGHEGSNLKGTTTAIMVWAVEFQPPYGSRLQCQQSSFEKWFADASNDIGCVMLSDRARPSQHWAFEQVIAPSPSQPSAQLLTQSSTQPSTHPPSQSTSQPFENKFFPLTVEQSAEQPEGKDYDIIIIGSGIGGGVLAHDLYETNQRLGPDAAKRILLLEKGGLVFHSHWLNTARRVGLENDRGQQNENFFLQFKENYQYTADSEQPKDPSEGQKSGLMFNLGGRSAAWGLFAPRIHDDVLENHFPKVHKDLLNLYYEKAERLMGLSLPTTKRIHQHIMDHITTSWRKMSRTNQVQWQWSRITSKSHDDRNVDPAEGAYNTIDKILEIAMSKPKTTSGMGEPQGNARQRTQEHEHFKTVLHADVRSLSFGEAGAINAVNVRTTQGNIIPIPVKPGGKVVLCAGSVNSPAILLRSEKAKSRDTWEMALLRHGGLHLTDHDIFTYSHSFHYSDAKQRDEFGGMKLQTYVDLGSEGLFPGMAHCNLSIDAASFLPKSGSPDLNLPHITIVFMLQRSLVANNNVSLDSSNEPVVEMIRGEGPGERQMRTMRELTASAMNSLKETAGLRFIGFEQKDIVECDIKLEMLDLGEVAHELGTLPMDTDKSQANCLDENLRIVPKLCDGVYVCDLSCFPYSPESNPALTLAALAIRLSRHLHPRHHNVSNIPSNQVRVVNHSGAKVRVWLSNHQPTGSSQPQPTDPAVELEPGKEASWTRDFGTVQVVLVYWPDLNKGNGAFQDEPVVIKAYPGKLLTIQKYRLAAD